MTFQVEDWHRRYREQARWTEQIRNRWFAQAGMQTASRILEVGCGTGAILETLAPSASQRLYGIDLQKNRLAYAGSCAAHASFLQANAILLPIASNSIDIVFSHYFFLWVQDPRAVAREIKRVVRPGGALLAFAEPDYGARIDYPEELAPMGELQTESLRAQGALPEMGRQVASVFSDAGLQVIETCILGSQWSSADNQNASGDEWEVLREDLGDAYSELEWETLKSINIRASKTGTRIVFVPTFSVFAINPA